MMVMMMMTMMMMMMMVVNDYGDRDRAGFNDMKMLWKLIQRDNLLVLQLPFDFL